MKAVAAAVFHRGGGFTYKRVGHVEGVVDGAAHFAEIRAGAHADDSGFEVAGGGAAADLCDFGGASAQAGAEHPPEGSPEIGYTGCTTGVLTMSAHAMLVSSRVWRESPKTNLA